MLIEKRVEPRRIHMKWISSSLIVGFYNVAKLSFFIVFVFVANIQLYF